MRFKLPKDRRILRLQRIARITRKVPHIKPVFYALLIILVLSVGILIGKQNQHIDSKDTTASKPSSQNISGNLTKEVPTFKTLLPKEKSISDFGGWTRVSPKDRAAAYGYADTISGTPIIVSQQELPEDFKNTADEQIDTLAEGYHANHIIYAGGGSIKVYVGTSSKGPQSVILTKSSLLLLIKSSAKIADDVWINYIDSLQ